MPTRPNLRFLIVCLSAVFVLLACSRPSTEQRTPSAVPLSTLLSSPTPSPTGEPTATPTSTDEPTARPNTPTPTQPPSQNTQYNLDVQLNYTAHSLEVSEIITYTNTTGEALSELMLVVEPNIQAWVFTLRELTWVGGGTVEGYTLDLRRLRLPLRTPLAPGGRVTLNLVYGLDLPKIVPESESGKPTVFGYSDRQTNLVDWYPYVPPYRGGVGWLVHDVWPFGETLVYDMGDYRVELQRTDEAPTVVIAASAPAEVVGSSYRYELESARMFVLSIGAEYQVLSEVVGDVTVNSYFFPWSAEGGQAVLAETIKALMLYEELFGPYPYTSLSAVEADFLDGMEYSAFYFLSRAFYDFYDGTPKTNLTIIAVHETGHQWWYGKVGNDQGLEPWLDEALCTYMERLFFERYYPDVLDFWWQNRIEFHQPTGWVNGAVWDYTAWRPYRNAVYLRGAQFLEALRQRVGDEAFFAFLKDYATRMAGKVATSEDFFAILKEHTSADISDLLVEYFKP